MATKVSLKSHLEEGVAKSSQHLEHTKANLVKFVSADPTYSLVLGNLASHTNLVAEAMGNQVAWIHASQSATDVESVRNRLLDDILYNQQSDTFSGRGNDVMRSYNDGFRRAIEKILYTIGSA